jgi:hypothetical protein
MNDLPRSNVFILQREKTTALDPVGPMGRALTAPLEELRMIVRQARHVNSPQLQALEGLLQAREETEGH